MELRNLGQVTALGIALTLVAAQATPPGGIRPVKLGAAAPGSERAIGTAVSASNFVMNERVMPGSGSVRNGAALATHAAGSTLHLDGGIRLDLAPHSRGRVYQDRLVLESGEAALEGSNRAALELPYRVEASELRVAPSRGARSAVGYETDGRLKVSAEGGPVRVTNRSGLLLAQVMPGRSVWLAPKAGPGTANTMSLVGTIEKRDNGLFLTDETAGITVKLQGIELDKYVGKKVRIAGKTDDQAARLEGIAATVVVERVQPVGSAAKKTGAAAGAAGGAAAGTGLSTTAIVVGGIAVAGAVTGTSVAVSRSGRSAIGRGTTAGPFGPQTISR